MYTLYCLNSGGSMAPEALLAACRAPYKVIVLERTANGSFEEFFHRINPKAEAPTLVLPDDSIMTESAAMMIHLADLHPEAKLSPAIGTPERARFLRWQVFLATQLYTSDLRMFYPERYTVAGAESAGIKARAIETMMGDFAIYADALGKGPFILGARMCAADIYAAMICTWAPDMGALFAAHPALQRMYAGVLQNDAVRKVWARNGV